jgi:putative redox protein
MEQIQIEWCGDGLKFEGERDGIRTAIDGEGKTGTSPVSLLLQSLTACTAADVVDILAKGRQDLHELRVTARGERRPEPPRRYTRFELKFEIVGDVDPKKAERAVQLSFDTYCSVYHTLKDDIELEWKVSVRPDPSP